MWIARDKDGEIHLFYNKPHRDTVYGGDYWTIDVPDEIKEYTKGWDHYDAIIGYWMKVNTDKYPNLKWEDEPIEVELKDCFELSEEAIAYAKEMNKRNIDKIIRKLEARIYAEQKRPNWKNFLYQYIQYGYYDIFIKGVNMIKKKLGWES